MPDNLNIKQIADEIDQALNGRSSDFSLMAKSFLQSEWKAIADHLHITPPVTQAASAETKCPICGSTDTAVDSESGPYCVGCAEKAERWSALVVDDVMVAVYPKPSDHIGSNPNGSMKPWFREHGYRIIPVTVTPAKRAQKESGR